jgi:hypothetical protein
MKPLRFVEVIWNDAWGTVNVDVTVDAVPHAPKVMTTRGWLLKEDEIGVSVATEKSTEDGIDHYRGHTFIPKGMVSSLSDYPAKRKKGPRRLPESTPPLVPETPRAARPDSQ